LTNWKRGLKGLFLTVFRVIFARPLIFVVAILQMPQDTIYLLQQNDPSHMGEHGIVTRSGDTVFLPDSFFGTGGYDGWQYQQQIATHQEAQQKKTNAYSNAGLMFFMAFLFIAVLAKQTNKVDDIFSWIKRKRMKKIVRRMEEDKGIIYDGWLRKYNPYYNSLSENEQQRFLLRTISFVQQKEFRFHSMVEEEYITVLISGAAVQMTFGMANYTMDYFPVIHIIRKEYVLNIDKETYYGHVSRNGIYISWSRFLEGYSDYEDCSNVGLHEMAHAVSYDVFLGSEDHHDRAFKERLESFTATAKPIFRAMRNGSVTILDDYALENFDEFWAVCIETFFENPGEFKETMPALYYSLVELLNQDPLKTDKVVNQLPEALVI
jgi:Mlc titration factor MtfA (ptsG expression regulator)